MQLEKQNVRHGKDRGLTKTANPPSGVLERGLHLLDCFTQDQPRLQLRELAEISGLDKATALRALKTLVEYNYLQKSADGYYSPGPMNLRLAALFRRTSNMVSRLEDPIQAISTRVNHTTSFFVRSNDDRMCLARDHAVRDFRYFIEVGASVSMKQGGAAAKVLEAFTDPENEVNARTRRNGYYISRGERNRHLASVGIPVFEGDGSFLGAIAITGMAVDLADEMLLDFARIAAEELSKVGLRTRQ